MIIRKAQKKDSAQILNLLNQVLELHAKIRPDIFVSGTTKYSESELSEILSDDSKPIFVAVDEKENVLGYAFCIIKEPSQAEYMVSNKILFLDDLCVDSKYRKKHIGKALFDFVKSEAKRLGCYEITLNVWEGNDNAKAFYDKLGMKPKETIMEFILD